jgi:signal transduction histidine kinase
MHIREWRHPQRQLLVAVVVVAVVSAGALAWLAWLLVQQDAALERQRLSDRLQQSADGAAAAIRVAVADLPARAAVDAPPPGATGDGLLLAEIRPFGVVLPEGARVLFLPGAPTATHGVTPAFGAAEALEFGGDLPGALRLYQIATASGADASRAAALVRAARVQRKMRRPGDALATYDRLAALDTTRVDELPASLVGRIGRASVFSETGERDRLRHEASALRDDLLVGRWPLTQAQFSFYRSEASAWLGTPVDADAHGLARSEALVWAWAEVRASREPGYRALRLPSGPVVVAWSPAVDHVGVVIGDARFLAATAGAAAGALPWSVRDGSGTTLAGDTRLAGTAAARVLADGGGDTWSVHVAPVAPAGAPGSPRRTLLLLTVTLAGLVVAAGWYFILRGMARERAASRAQADFVAAVSHEFRSPLTSVSHVAELLASGRLAEHSRSQAYDVLVRDTERLRTLVEQVLEFGRFEAGGPVLSLERIDVADAVRTVVEDFGARVARDGYRVEFEGPGGPLFMEADRQALALALWNLMDNAVKYSPDGRTVWVRLRAADRRVHIDVRDEGLGIPPGEQADIFRQFVRGAEPKARRIRGTGIGLALVRHVARAHGGDVTVESAPGLGSTFTVQLPLAGQAE